MSSTLTYQRIKSSEPAVNDSKDVFRILRKFENIYVNANLHPGPEYTFYSNTLIEEVEATVNYAGRKCVVLDTALNAKSEPIPDRKAIFIEK